MRELRIFRATLWPKETRLANSFQCACRPQSGKHVCRKEWANSQPPGQGEPLKFLNSRIQILLSETICITHSHDSFAMMLLLLVHTVVTVDMMFSSGCGGRKVREEE